MRTLICAAICAWLPSLATAQTTPSAARPDTLGANFDGAVIGPATADGFDFLVGDWTFVFQGRQRGDEWSPPTRGTWKVEKTRSGLVIADVWQLEGSTDPTLSWRVFNPTRKVWEMQGLKARRGSWDPGLAWGTGSERFVVQTFTGVSQARIKYYNIQRDSFSWRADVSVDGGKTWMRDAWLIEATRVNP